MPIEVYIIGFAGIALTMGMSYFLRNSFKLAPQLLFFIIGSGFAVATSFVESWVGLGYMILAIMFVAVSVISTFLTALLIRKD
jgi:hypothetical protein